MANRLLTICLVLIVFLLAPLAASAQQSDLIDGVDIVDEPDQNEFMFTLRARAVTVPDFVLGLFMDNHSSHWSDGHKNMSYGGEFVWRRGSDFELGFALDYADLSMPGDFWLEKDQDPQKADWTSVDLRLLSVVFSAYWFWDVMPWFAPYVGGGIGPGFIMGNITYYQPDRSHICYSDLGRDPGFAPPGCFLPSGEPDPEAINLDRPDIEDRVPPIIPVINVTVGARFTIADHLVLKLEGGFYDYFFAGAAVGAQW